MLAQAMCVMIPMWEPHTVGESQFSPPITKSESAAGTFSGSAISQV